MHRIAGAPRPPLGALSGRNQVIRRNRDVADEPLGSEVDRNIAIQRSPDALEYDLPEALAFRLPDRRPAALQPIELDPVIAWITPPTDCNRAGRARQRAVLGRVGGKLMHNQAERLHG